MNLRKSVFAIFLASFVGIMSNPEILTASDSVKIYGLDNSGIAETVLVSAATLASPETAATISQPVTLAKATSATTAATPVAAKAKAAPSTSVTPAPIATTVSTPVTGDRITVSGNTLSLNSTTTLSGNASYNSATAWSYETTGKFIYAHDSAAAFAPIKNFRTGSTFSVTKNGVTTTYRVAHTETYDCVMNGSTCTKLQLAGQGNYGNSGKYSIYNGYYHNPADDTAAWYDLTLMTCAAGNTKRFVVFANIVK